MKSFLSFFGEARKTRASERAHQLGLRSDGQGNWVNQQGQKVAKTVGQELVFTDRKQPKSQEAPTPQRKSGAPETTQKQKTSQPVDGEQKKSEDEKSSEKEGETLTLVFGRFNPPTVGHKKLLDNAYKVSQGGDFKIYPSRSYDPKKNPLDPDQKIRLMKKMYPDYSDNIENDADVKTIFDALEIADNEGYSNVQIVVGSDRVAEFDNLAQKYNGDLYNFDEIQTISAGERDDDAEGVTGMSASKLRKAAAENDFEAFRRGIPDSLDDGTAKAIMNSVRKGMKVSSESWNLWEIAPKFDWKNLRENYVNRRIFNVDQLVENLNTGLVGKIVRRGTNYLICVTENNIMFKSWINDLNEYTEVKMDRKMRTKTKSNTLVGTKGYFKYASDLTPGHEEGGQNLQPGGKAYTGSIKEFINKYKKRI
jgi:hypothetical protein